MANGKLINPLVQMQFRNDGGLRNVFGATYGNTRTKIESGVVKPKAHHGWDLFAKEGTDCFAIGDGWVTWKGSKTGYGRSLLLQLNKDGSNLTSSPENTLYTFYAHLSQISVEVGRPVKAGQLVGKTGIDGNANPKYPHLHLEIWTNCDPNVVLASKDKYRIDPAAVFGYALFSCKSEEISPGLDIVNAVCFTPEPQPIGH